MRRWVIEELHCPACQNGGVCVANDTVGELQITSEIWMRLTKSMVKG